MGRHLLIPQEVASRIRRLHPGIKRKVRAALDALVDERVGGKPLRDRLLGLWSLPVGRLRIVYRPAGRDVQIIALGPRRTIYEEVARLARQDPAR